jgi:hypothetical protein
MSGRRRSIGWVVGALSVSLAPSACGGGNAASKMVTPPRFEPEGQTKCGVKKSQERPLIVEWPSPDRQELEDTIRTGVAVVSYSGCEIRVLDRCTAPSKYGYTGLTRAVDKVVIKDADELYANLPVGAAKLEGTLHRSGQLTVGMNLVGRYRADRQTVRADELQGDCAGATHFVYGVTVGAFDFYAGGDAKVTGSAGIGSVGVGGSSQAERETITQVGDESACTKSAPGDKEPPAQCGALIRIEVVPLGEAKAMAPTCPGGTQWDGSQCVGTRVVTDVQCPGGTTWNGNQCVGSAPGIAAVTPVPVPAVVPAPASAAPSSGGCPAGMANLKGGRFTMGDRHDAVTVRHFCLDTTEVTTDA